MGDCSGQIALTQARQVRQNNHAFAGLGQERGKREEPWGKAGVFEDCGATTTAGVPAVGIAPLLVEELESDGFVLQGCQIPTAQPEAVETEMPETEMPEVETPEAETP